MLEFGMKMLCFFEFRCVQQSIKTLSIYWFHDEKLITLVLGSQNLLTQGKTRTLSCPAFNLDALNWSHYLQGLGQSELRGQEWVAVHLWPCDSACTGEAPALNEIFGISLLNFSPWLNQNYMNDLKAHLPIHKKRVRSFVKLSCKTHVHYKFIRTFKWKYGRITNITNLIEDNKMRSIKPKTITVDINVSHS